MYDLTTASARTWFEGDEGLRQRCVLSSLLFGIFLAGVLTNALQRISEDTDILAGLLQLKKPPTLMGPEPAMDYVHDAVWGVLFTRKTPALCCRSPRGFAKMM